MSSTEVLSFGCDTLPKLFMKMSAERGDRIAMREKDFGIWQSYSWAFYREQALAIANGLLSLGLQRGDVVSIQSEDCKEWLFADLGGLLAGGVVNGVYPTYQSRQVEHALTDSKARFLFVEDEEQLDKYLEIESRMPAVEKVFVFDWKGLRGFEHEKVAPIEDLYEAGRAYGQEHPDRVERIVADGRPDDLAILIYTSGTTGMPKGSMISQRYIMFQINLAPDAVRQTETDELLTYLPLCHVAERIFSGWAPVATGATINFAESPETVAQNLVELSPTYMFAVPRVLEKFYSRVTTAMSEGTWVGRKAFETAMRIGMRRADALLDGQKPSATTEIQFQIADRIVFRNIKKLLGLDRVHGLVSGAAPISTALLKWFLAMGIPVDEAYGQTEAGVVTVTRKGVFRLGTVGPAAAGVDIRISDEGEVLLRSPGNIGTLDEEGNLSITDRLKDIIITAGGKNITPSVIENELKFSPYVSDAVIIGDKRKYLTCLIMIDQENVEHYAQTHVRLIDVLLTAEDDELTPTMKLKRSFINEKYSTLIESMYGN